MGGVPNVCMLAGNAVTALQRMVPRSIAQVFVNFPEPPVRRGGGGSSGEASQDETCAPPHLLTVDTFRLIRRVLKPGGSLCILSDNVTYVRQLAGLVDAAGGFGTCHPGGDAQGSKLEGVHTRVWRGEPGTTCGIPDPKASSYFDRLWRNGKLARRDFLFV